MEVSISSVDWLSIMERFSLLPSQDWSKDVCSLYKEFFGLQKDGESTGALHSLCNSASTQHMYPVLSNLFLLQLFVTIFFLVALCLPSPPASATLKREKRKSTYENRWMLSFGIVSIVGFFHFGYWYFWEANLSSSAPEAFASISEHSRSYIDSWEPLVGLAWEDAHGQDIYNTFIAHEDGSIRKGPTDLPSCSKKYNNQNSKSLQLLMHQFDTRGFEGIPEIRKKSVLEWKEAMDQIGVEHLFWDEISIKAVMKIEFPLLLNVYNRLTQPVARADMAPYFLLYRFGGFYADTDRIPVTFGSDLENIFNLSQGSIGMTVTTVENFASASAAYMSYNHRILRYNIDVMFAAVGHPYLLRMLANIYYQMADTQPMGWALGSVSRFFFRGGPEAASRLLHRHLEVVECADFDYSLLIDSNFDVLKKNMNVNDAGKNKVSTFATSTMDLGSWVSPFEPLFYLNLILVLVNLCSGGILDKYPILTLLGYEFTLFFFLFFVPLAFFSFSRRRLISLLVKKQAKKNK